jgi:site-specific DNA recombinase
LKPYTVIRAAERKRVLTQIDRRRRLRLLPGSQDLEKIARYEGHIERSLYRALHDLQRLQAAHAVKGERRYRYYVLRNLISGTPDSGRGAWRLPAPEIERTVASAAYTILSDEAAIANAALATGLAEHRLPSLLSLAAAWMNCLQSNIEMGTALSTLVDRVELIEAGIRVSLKFAISITEEQHGANDTALSITRVFPMQIRRRGIEMRLVIQGNRAPAALADLALIELIAKGRSWADDLLAGRVASVAAIAKRVGVLPNYVWRLTRLAFLAPRIVKAIAAGHQPPELTAKALTERIELSLLWSEQERAVGIN